MAKTAADILIETLQDWGVNLIFGLPGDGINGIMESLRVRQDSIRFIQVRHEESAAFMACAYAKYTGKLGVCLATSGPGGIHLLNGLYDAKLDGQPVLAITGHHYHDLIDTHQQQDVSLDRTFMDVTIYNSRIMGPSHVQNVADLACRTALAMRGVAHINFPVDLQTIEIDEAHRSKRNVPAHSSDAFAQQANLPSEEELQKAAALLNQGEKIAILAGRGSLHATDELEALAEKLGAPIIKALLGKAAVPDDSPYTTGTTGHLGTKPSIDALEECDTLFIIGSSFPYIEYYPKPKQARAVQIDLDPSRIGLRFPVELGLLGDSKAVIQRLLPMLKRNENRKFLEKAQEGMKDWWELMETQASVSEAPMKPQVVAWELGKRLRDDAIVSTDSGTIATWWARHVKVKRGQMHSISGNLASMANALPYTLAAQLAYPDRQCVAIVGDGGFSMLMAEFATAVKYELPIKVIIFKNNVLGMIKWEQISFLGNPQYGVQLQPIDFAMVARACGGTGFSLEDPKLCGDVLDEAFNTPGPVLVEAVIDPLEPPLPPKMTLKDYKLIMEAIAKGQPEGLDIIKTFMEDRIREVL
jgi:pyruvate dehydrogenase (quinone)